MTPLFKHRFTLVVNYFTFFTDLMGYAIVFPIFAPVFLSPQETWLASYSFEMRSLFFGLLLLCYVFAQWAGSPFFARLASTKESKPILLITLFLTSMGFIITAFGFLHEHLLLIFLGRLVGGFSTGNSSLVTNLNKNITAKPSLMLAGGFGLIVGPLLVGILADSSVLEWFSTVLPFWVMASLTGINFFLVFFLKPSPSAITPSQPSSFKARLSVLTYLWKNPAWARACNSVFFFFLGWFGFIQFTAVFLLIRFNFSESEIGFYFALMGLAWCTALMFNKVYALGILLTLAAISSFITIFVNSWIVFSAFIFLLVMACTLVWTQIGAFFENLTSDENVEELTFFAYQSSAFAALLATFFCGLLLLVDYSLIFAFTALCFLISAWLKFTGRPAA